MHKLQVSILSERRTRQPYGAAGGGPGMMGRNIWVKQLREEDGDLLDEAQADPLADKENRKPSSTLREPREINIGGKATILMGKGDRLVIETPGGGAWGSVEEGEDGKQGGVVEKVKGLVEWAARGSLAERAAAQAGF